MTDWTTDLQSLISAEWWHSALVFFRVSAMVSVLPGFGSRIVPPRINLVLALAFTAVITPAVTASAPPSDPAQLLMQVLPETIVGLTLGIGLRLLVIALQIAGSMAAQSTSLSQILGNSGTDPMPAIGQVLMVGGLAAAMLLGLHVHATKLMVMSYDLFPVGQFPDAGTLADWGVGQSAQAFALAFTLAAPFVIFSALYNLALGVINRAMPQLMVAFVGAPAVTFGGLFILFVAAPLILTRWAEVLLAFVASPFGGAR